MRSLHVIKINPVDGDHGSEFAGSELLFSEDIDESPLEKSSITSARFAFSVLVTCTRAELASFRTLQLYPPKYHDRRLSAKQACSVSDQHRKTQKNTA